MSPFAGGRRRLSAGLLVVAALCVAGITAATAAAHPSRSANSTAAGKTYTIGGELPLTGILALYGVPINKGISVAVNEINRTHFLGNDQIKFNVKDDQNDTPTEISLFKNFQSSNAIGVLCCEAGALAIPLVPVITAAKLPTIVTNGASPDLAKPPYVYRVFYDPATPGGLYDQTIDAAAKYVKPKTAVIIVNTDSQTFAGVATTFATRLAKDHIQLLDTLSTLTTDTDFSGVATKVVSEHPDLVIADETAPAVANTMRSLSQFGYKGTVVTNYGVDQRATFNIAGAAMGGIVFATPFSTLTANPVGQSFVKLYQAKYGQAPDLFGSHGYDSMWMMARAIKAAKATGSVTRASVAKALSAMKTFSSTGGEYTLKGGQAYYNGTALFVRWNADGSQTRVWQSKN
jgi:branched-chain amino acid transport system substrate-binding protein